jgi:phosphoglycerate dehydrogenase-like enzyme
VPRFKVFIPEPFPPEAYAVIADVADVTVGAADRAYPEDELIGLVKDVDALVITSRDRITANVIDAAPVLKVITKSGARPVNVDVDAAQRRGIVVTWTPGANAVSVAEHALMLMLALSTRLFVYSRRLREGGWRDLSIVGFELTGKTVGLIGFGSVGRQLQRKLSGFDVRLLVHDPLVPAAAIRSAHATPASLDELLEQSDVVSIHSELTDATRGMIGERALRRMRPTALLINTARGPIVDEQALHRALTEGWIAGAGLDVFQTEPTPRSNPLLALENVVATPHSAAFARESMARETTWAVEDARAILLGQAPLHWTANP